MTGSGATSLDVQIDRKSYARSNRTDSRIAIEDMVFSVPAGQFVCIVGPSGCGKTTLMNIIAGLDQSVEGAVRFGHDAPVHSIRKSYMFQTPRLLPWLTVRDNVAVVLDSQKATSGLAEEVLGQMSLSESLDEYPNRLSGGMQRRVALARAFVTRPQLLLLDEPFVSLDVPVGNRLRTLLLDMWGAQPTTVLFVTHDLREAIFLADRILFLSNSPARVILDELVPLPRPRDADDIAIDDFRRSLLDRHEKLLHGLTSNVTDRQSEPNKETIEAQA